MPAIALYTLFLLSSASVHFRGTPTLGQLFAVLTAFCWAQNSIIYSITGKKVTSGTVTHIRLWIALPAMAVVHFFFIGSFLPGVGLTPESAALFISGLIGFFVADIFIFYAFVVIGPGRTLLLLTLSPIFSAFFSFIFIGEILNPLQVVGILVTISGILLVIFNENKVSILDASKKRGIIFALTGTTAQAAGMILAKIGLSGGIHPVSANLIRITAGLAGLIIFSAIRRTFIEDFRKMRDVKTLGLISAGALVGPVLGIILTLYAMRLAPVGIVTTLMQISPVILLPIEVIFMKRRVNIAILGGTFIAVAGAVMLFLFPGV